MWPKTFWGDSQVLCLWPKEMYGFPKDERKVTFALEVNPRDVDALVEINILVYKHD